VDSYRRSELQQALARANDFVPAALPANRQGRLTTEQARSLERQDRGDRRALFLVGWLAVLGACIYLGFDVRARGSAALRNDGGAYIALVVGVLLMALGAFWKEYQTDLEHAEVAVVEGRGTREISNADDGPPIYAYIIGALDGVRFEIGEAGYHPFVEGQYYRAYYLPYSGKLVNIEVIEQDVARATAGLPSCPVCNSTETVSHILSTDPARTQSAGCGSFFFHFNLLVYLARRRNPVREQAEARARRAKLTMLGERGLYFCKRDQLVFARGGTKAVPVAELTKMLQQRDWTEVITALFSGEAGFRDSRE
jgi:hypothetical protein